jgi:predicted dehydrogenase
MSAALAVGLVGAGPWAAMVHAPMLAAGPETRLAGVWARRREAARSLAAAHGVPAFATLDELLDNSEAIAFAIAPGAQPDLATRAARAGKAVLLEKPLADSLGPAQRLADAVGEAGVGSLVVLTARFAAPVQEFLERARASTATGGRSWFLSGAFLSGPFSASPWRHDRGSLLDVGPHALDLITAAIGPATVTGADASPDGFVALTLRHDGGAVSQVSLCSTLPIPDARSGVEVYGSDGMLAIDVQAALGPDTFARLRAEFAEIARTATDHPCDVHRGLYLQELVASAETALGQ